MLFAPGQTKPSVWAGLVLLSAGSLFAQSFQTLSVSAQMDIYRAGGYNDGGNGAAPAVYTFSATPGQALSFSSITGTWTCSSGQTAYGPDGNSGPCDNPGTAQHINNPIGPFSGIDTTDFDGALVGVFLEDALPVSAPPPLRFYVSDNSKGGIQTNFASLSPQIGQVFFIGDGRTGTAAGAVQVFNVPPLATHLYLGYIDSCGDTTPGCFADNSGSLSATFAITACAFQVRNVTPQVQLPDRAWATQAGVMLSWKSGKSISGLAAAAIADSVAPATTQFVTDYANGGIAGCAALNNCSISLTDYTSLLVRLGITQPDITPSVCSLAARLRGFGPMTLVTGAPGPNFVHAVVLTGITGDGAANGAAVNLVDPVTGAASSQSFGALLIGLQPAVAAGWPEFVQFP